MSDKSRRAQWRSCGLLLVLCGLPSAALAQGSQETSVSADQALVDRSMKGGTGECVVQDAATCKTCACQYYLKTRLATWSGHGWPLNPESRDGTGCVSAHRYGGYTESMATNSLIHNAAEQLRDALAHPADPCGLKLGKDRKITPEMVLGEAPKRSNPVPQNQNGDEPETGKRVPKAEGQSGPKANGKPPPSR